MKILVIEDEQRVANLMMKNSKHWAAIGILISIGMRMLHELITRNKEMHAENFETKVVLTLGLNTSIYVFAFGCAVHWLELNEHEARGSILLLIFLFLAAGSLLGGFHYEKLLKWIQIMAAFLVLEGAVILSL